MDPLAEAYGKLKLEDAGKTDLQIKEKSITETRIFLIEVTIAALFLVVFGFLRMNWSNIPINNSIHSRIFLL